MASMNSLKDLYVDQLQDNYSANKQMAAVVSEFHGAAKNPKLKSMLSTSKDKIAEHNETLKSIIQAHDADPNGEHCKGMEGLVKEGRAHGLEAQFGDPSVQDAAIITQMQRMSHYGLAAYGTCKAMARQLGLSDDAKRLDEGLDDIYEADDYLSMLAETDVNEDAAH
ncbi:ferritin-like domain-containing protein [Parvularcula dongshanensis]|uniref:Ferritin-like metal-binding protein YciE n=1 Tax=Parvularcula dongshanensis TaxID=1173995 RepID=A0A840I7T2_9PROT|nr:DUF892 family protein [Parvularcula dongshanensis]MBB4660020.1 ferritin-like metal-binding protein YciE [Parvularcula dongshanensis]